MSLVNYSARHDVNLQYIGTTERTLIDTARTVLAREFLKTPSEWSFWMDADMVIPKETLVSLLKVAKDKDAKMVTGVYHQRGGKHWPVLWTRSPELENGNKPKVINQDEYDQNEYVGMYTVPGPEAKEPFKVHSAGFGCCLIHRNVFEATDDPWFRFLYKKCSEDFYFFVNAAKKGYQLWADPSIRLGHIASPQIIYKEDCYKSMEDNETSLEPIKKEE
jgi:GT2 family glycosyltransferase